MAKSKEQKRAEALERLNARIAERGGKPTFSQRMEHNALSYPKRVKTDAEKLSEKLFGLGDPVTGIIYVDPLPLDFRPTPELEQIVATLKSSKERFVEIRVNLESPPEGYRYATYEGSGNYMDQWVSRHTPYRVHHGKHLYGVHIVIVFSHPDEIPCSGEDDRLISGTTQEMYERRRYA